MVVLYYKQGCETIPSQFRALGKEHLQEDGTFTLQMDLDAT